MISPQVLKAENEALYFIIGSEVRADNFESRRVIGVSANTLLKGVRIAYTNYRQVHQSQYGNALFVNTSAIVHAAVQANPWTEPACSIHLFADFVDSPGIPE
ncbi:hypothetical protein [Pseudomonas sp. Sample_23]|uniref:hypothetical protein n=1 Tax=Pseudomonas sp. Sample_23 TaxID=2448267 RepID=UPI0010328369|nr:hypothetical protein [Pseudomonas sp. Sample_23]